MKFVTQFDSDFKIIGEKMDPKTIFSIAGYRDTRTMVEDFIYSGKRLEASRMEQYDYSPDVDIDDVPVNPTQRRGFDMVDADNVMEALKDKAKSAKLSTSQHEDALKKASIVDPVDNKADDHAEDVLAVK